MKTFRSFISLKPAATLALAAGFFVFMGGVEARPLPQVSTQPVNPPQTRPAPRPSPGKPAQPSPGKPQQPSRPPSKPGKPGDRPSIQPVPGPGKPQPGKPINRPVRPTPLPGPRPQPGKPGYRPPSRPPGYRPPPYNWRPGDYDRMRRYYRRNFGYINRGRRPVFIIGGYIPFGDRGYFTPIPPGLLTYLPPPPPGYVIGYFDGYAVVYDPITFEIISFADLLS
jgi:hypothetical protein